MRTIGARPVRFGEVAGPLLHGPVFFDWQLISTQAVAAEAGHAFPDIVEEGGIPYAPVVASTEVHRYPTFRDTISVRAVPVRVGRSSVEIRYETADGDGARLADARIVHVTIAPDGGALELPSGVRDRLAALKGERDGETEPVPDPGPGGPDDAPGRAPDEGADLPVFESSLPVRRVLLEGSELAYFEEYPRLAERSMEVFLQGRGVSLRGLSGEKQPFRPRRWRWEFRAPVRWESVLAVRSDVRRVGPEWIRIAYSMRSGGRVRIDGITEYGCFDRRGRAVAFDPEMLAPFGG